MTFGEAFMQAFTTLVSWDFIGGLVGVIAAVVFLGLVIVALVLAVAFIVILALIGWERIRLVRRSDDRQD